MFIGIAEIPFVRLCYIKFSDKDLNSVWVSEVTAVLYPTEGFSHKGNSMFTVSLLLQMPNNVENFILNGMQCRRMVCWV